MIHPIQHTSSLCSPTVKIRASANVSIRLRHFRTPLPELHNVEKLLADKFRTILTNRTARRVSFFKICCAKINFRLLCVPKYFRFQGVGLKHGVFQQNNPKLTLQFFRHWWVSGWLSGRLQGFWSNQCFLIFGNRDFMLSILNKSS